MEREHRKDPTNECINCSWAWHSLQSLEFAYVHGRVGFNFMTHRNVGTTCRKNAVNGRRSQQVRFIYAKARQRFVS